METVKSTCVETVRGNINRRCEVRSMFIRERAIFDVNNILITESSITTYPAFKSTLNQILSNTESNNIADQEELSATSKTTGDLITRQVNFCFV